MSKIWIGRKIFENPVCIMKHFKTLDGNINLKMPDKYMYVLAEMKAKT